MDASTIMPTPKIKPVSVIMLSVSPAKFMHKSVMTIESGIEIAIIIVDLPDFRNRNKMMTASKRPVYADSMSVLIVSLIDVEESRITSSRMSLGRLSWISASFSRVAAATVTVFLPDCFVMLTYTPGCPLM